MNKIKLTLFSTLFTVLMLVVSLQSILVPKTEAFNIERFIICRLGEPGKQYLKVKQTDYLPYLIASKSSTNVVDSPNNILNLVLKGVGYSLDREEASTPFDKFGLAGLKFTSYTGEWKYYDVDPCDTGDRQVPVSTNFGIFYEGRKDPLSTYGELHSTTDIRTMEYARGRFPAFLKAYSDNVSNMILFVAKFVMTLTLAVVSLSFSDVSTIVGLGNTQQATLFSNLYHGLFMPLIPVFILLTIAQLFWLSVWKKQFRLTLSSLLRVFGCFALAVLLNVRPDFLLLPSKLLLATQTITVTSLADTFKGEDKGLLCDVNVENTITDVFDERFIESQVDYMRSVIGCRLWSEVLVKPFVKGQFGVHYEELNQLNNENSSWVGTPQVKLKDRTIENWGLFHISVMSGNHTPLDGIDSQLVGGVNKDFYRIVDALANYEETVEIDTDRVDTVDSVHTLDTSDWTQPGTERYQVAQTMYRILTEKYGFSGVSASGVIGNALQESGLSVSALEGEYGQSYSARGYGLFQFTPKEKYLESGYHNPNDSIEAQIERQIDFMMDSEFKRGTYKNYLQNCSRWFGFTCSTESLFNASSTDEAALAFFAVYERGDTHHMNRSRRLQAAATANQLFNAENLPATPALWGAPTGADHLASPLTLDSVNDIDKVPVPKNNPPLKEWSAWVGNNAGERLGYSFVMVSLTLASALPIAFFSILSITYSLAFSLLLMFLPVFLLFGCWAVVGETIFKKYLGTILQTVMKKLVSMLLLLLVITLAINTLRLLDKIGYFHALLLLALFTYILIIKREYLISSVARLNLDTMGDFGIGQVIQSSKELAKDATDVISSTVIGGLASKKTGGKFRNGAYKSMVNTLKNKAYKSKIGRTAMLTYNTTNKGDGNDVLNNRICTICGIALQEGDIVYVDEFENYYCEICASTSGYNGMRQVEIDNIEDYTEKVTRNNQEVEVLQADGTIQTTTYFTQKEFAKDLGLSDLSPDKWASEKEKVQQRIVDSLSILLDDQYSIVNSVEGGHFQDYFIPEPLRTIISPADMQKAVEAGKHDGMASYVALIEKGWYKWYHMQGTVRGQATKEIHNDIQNMKATMSKILDCYKQREEKANG